MKIGYRLGKRGQIVTAAVATALIVLSLAIFIQSRSEEDASSNNLLFFALINVNIIALLVLIVLVVRNVVKLMFERRQGILGAKLRARLMGSFVLIALIPMGISFLVASGLINQAIQGWFSTQIEAIVSSSLSVARQYVAETRISVETAASRVQSSLSKRGAISERDASSLKDALEELRHLNDLYSIRIVNSGGVVVVESAHATAEVEGFAEPPLEREAIVQALRGTKQVLVEERGASQFIRVYQPLDSLVVVSSYRMDPELVHAQSVVTDAYREYDGLKQFKQPLRTNFFLILGLCNLLTLFGAIWVAFFVSRQITGPIQTLAEGTRRVARGMYDFRLKADRDDELGFLVTSFNQMLQDLKGSREEAEGRGLLIQTILANLAVGVVALDPDGRVTAVNGAARELLNISEDTETGGRLLSETLGTEQFAVIGPVLDSLRRLPVEAEQGAAAEVELRLQSAGRQLLVVCTAGRIVGREAQILGYVLLFDDVTDISRSQHLAAWRDVARRIAHEIKNPLTPLQLSAQRLEKLLQGSDPTGAVAESTRSIVEHVEIIKRLANEFSEYGRMPTAQFVPTDLPTLVSNVTRSFAAEHPDIAFSCTEENKVPEVLLDPEQIRGVLINVIANAVSAVRGSGMNGVGAIAITLSFDRKSARAQLQVADNGPGIPAQDKNRVFEPYFTTKKGGTGLGLAIVSSVVSDHQGEVRIFDNTPHGVRLVITLPQHPHATTVRKFGAGGASPN